MGQDDILKLLKKEKGWLSTREVEEKLKVSDASRPLGVLLKHGEILRKEVKVNCHYQYQWMIK